MKPLCLIPARGGSKRIPGKNLREFCGVPALQRVITMCRDSDLFRDVVVSSEDSKTLGMAEEWGATPLYCSTEYAHRDDSMLEDVLDHALRERPEATTVCMVLATAVLVTPRMLEWSREAFAVTGPLPLVCYYAFGRDAGQFYWIDREYYEWERRNGFELLNATHTAFPVSPDRVQDINTEEDWKLAEEKYRRLHA